MLTALLPLILLYGLFDPSQVGWFPRCPFRVITGLECPGCGSQRALHHLLHLRIGQAASNNLLLVVSLPYILLGLVINAVDKPGERLIKLRKSLYGQRAIMIVLMLIILFWILRNFSDKF